jgi:hypothetical protein
MVTSKYLNNVKGNVQQAKVFQAAQKSHLHVLHNTIYG